MSVQVKPYTFFNNTTADADEVNADFDVLYSLQAGGLDSANLNLNANYTWGAASAHSFASQNLRIRSAGAGVARLATFGSWATDRVIQIPDPGTSALFLISETDQLINGSKNFQSANGVRVPGVQPTLSRGLGFNSNFLTYHDGTAERFVVDNAKDQNIGGEKTFTSQNGIKMPNTDPNEDRGLGFVGDMLKAHNGSLLLQFPSREKDHVVAYNVRMTLSGGTIKFCGDNGSDWSSTNPGIFKIYSATAGKWDEVIFTSSPTFDDATNGTDSDFVGTGTMSMGTAAGVAWASSMPIFWYVCTDGTTPLIGFSRIPCMALTSGSFIGYKDVAPSSASQKNIIFLTATNPTVTHAAKPVTLIGSSTITKNASNNWTFGALGNLDGVLNFKNCEIYWDMPAAQNGGGGTAPIAARWFKANGGTAPQFSTNNISYLISREGECHLTFQFQNDGGTDGAGAGNLSLSLPFSLIQSELGAVVPMIRAGSAFVTWVANNQMCFPSIQTANPTDCFFFRNSSATAVTAVILSDFANGAREVSGDVRFPVQRS